MTTLKIYNYQIVNGRIPDDILRSIPAETTTLDLSDCESLTTLPESLPEGLKELNLLKCSNLSTLPKLSTSIEYLNLSGCTRLSPQSIAQLLALKYANRDNPRFRLIWPEHLVSNKEAIMESLKKSYQAYYANDPFFAGVDPKVNHLTNFQTLRLFHRITSEDLRIHDEKEVIAQAYLVAEEIKKKPELLEILDKVSENYIATSFNQPVNGFLEISSLKAIAKIKNDQIVDGKIPDEIIPEETTLLDFSWCESLTALPTIPMYLQYLYLVRCSNLTTLPSLPAGLKQLDLSGCSNLTTLPDLPTSIKYLDLSGCNSLSPESVRKLLALEKANRYNPRFRLIWPQHLVSNSQVMTSLKESYKTYYANDPAFVRIEPSVANPNFKTLKLFHGFTSERLAERGEREVFAQAYLVAEEIRKKPELLEILDKVSDYYVADCVNQRVNGFLEIASLMAIAKEDDITAKIAKAKILRAQQLIKNHISSLRNSDISSLRNSDNRTVSCLGIFNRLFNRQNLQDATVGRGVEVELGNAMIREVHNKLLADKVIQEPWLGVPRNISYERSIRSFLTDGNITKMTNIAKEALSAENSEQEAIEFLCSTQTEFWAKMIFSKAEREAFDQEHNERIQQLRDQILELNPNDAGESNQIRQLEQKIDEIETAKSTQFDKKLKQKTKELIELTKSNQNSHQIRSPRHSQHYGEEHGGMGGVFGWHRPDQLQITPTHQSPQDLRASQDFGPRTSLDGQASAEADPALSCVLPRPIEPDPSQASGLTFLRIGLFEELAPRDQFQISGHLDFLDERLPETAFDQHHQRSSQGFGNSLRQARTGRESEQLFTTALAPQNSENSVSANLFFPEPFLEIKSNSSSQLLPNPAPVRTDSSSLRDQADSTFKWSATC